MTSIDRSRRRWFALFVGAALVLGSISRPAGAQDEKPVDPLPSWNAGPAKQAVLDFVKAATLEGSPTFVPVGERFATFDQDGTLWVEQPMYTQVMFTLDRIVAIAAQHPEWKTTEPFKTVLAGDKQALAELTMPQLEQVFLAAHTGMTTDEFQTIVKDWLATAKHPRWQRPYTELVYQPMLELLNYLRGAGFKTYIVTGGGQEFVRTFAERVYGIPREQVIGSALEAEFEYKPDGKSLLTRPPKLLLNDNFSGKPEDIHLFLGRRPQAAFGNSTGDQQMLEYTQASAGAKLMMLVLHDDAQREYAYGPATGLPNSKVGTFTQALYDEATGNGWSVISMKKDWKRIFPFEK